MSDSRRRGALAPILYSLLVVVGVFAIDRTAAAAMRALLLHSDDRAAHVYAGGRTDDVVILGNSVGNAMANPVDLANLTHRRVFTIAMHGLDALTQEAFARDYLMLNAPPRLALLEVRSARGGLIRAQEFGPFIRPGTHMSELVDHSQESILPWRKIFQIYNFNTPHLPKTLQNLVDRDDQATGASDGHISAAIIAAWRKISEIDSIDPAAVRAFAATIGAFDAAGTVPVVILAPLHPSGRDQAQLPRSDVLPYLPMNILVCDFTDYLDDDKYFEDPVHLNNAGRAAIAPLFAALIARELDPIPLAETSETAQAIGKRCGRSTSKSAAR